MSVRASTLAWLALPLLAGLSYASALHNPFVYDDLVAIADNALIRQLDLAPLFLRGGITSSGFANGQFRPLTILTFALNYRAGGVDPFGYRLVNLILHALNAIAGAWLLRALLSQIPWRRGRAPMPTASAHAIALLSAAIFVVHPINALGVLLVWKRATLLSTLFSLLSVCCLVALRRPSAEPQRWRRLGLYFGVWANQCLALGCKEDAAILPATLLVVDLCLATGPTLRLRLREVARLQVPALLIGTAGAAYLVTHAPHKVEMAWWMYLATQAKVLWSYVAMTVAPPLISVVYEVPAPQPRDVSMWLGALGIVGVALVAGRARRRLPFVALAVLWAALAVAPTSSVIPIPLPKDEGRVYLAFLLLWTLPALAWVWLGGLPGKGRQLLARVGGAAMLVTLMGFTVARAALWSSAETLWFDAITNHPNSVIASSNYCAAILRQPEKAHQAVAVCAKAAARDPKDQQQQAALVQAYVSAGDIDRAEAILRPLLASEQPSPQLLRLAGHLAWFHARPGEAIAYYRRVLEQQPFDLESVLYMARSNVDLGAIENARSLALQLDRWTPPSDRTFRLALAELHRALGWRDRACVEYAAVAPTLPGGPPTSLDHQRLASACTGAR